MPFDSAQDDNPILYKKGILKIRMPFLCLLIVIYFQPPPNAR